MAFSVLRFTSVLIGAGLLLRTASAEHVVSATQEPGTEVKSSRLAAGAPVALVLPKPAFGAPVKADPTALAPIAPRAAGSRASHPHAAVQHETELASAHPVVDSDSPAAARLPREDRQADRAAMATASQPQDQAGSVPLRREQSVAALLTPARVVGVAASPRPAAPMAAPTPDLVAPASAPASTVASPPQVQISLAPPVMRPGPRKTVLTTDVHAEMRRAASAWDYAEGLPPELMGRPAGGQRQAAVAPKLPVPPSAASGGEAAVAVPVASASALPLRAEAASVAANADAAPQPPARQRKIAARPLALLDRPPARANATPRGHGSRFAVAPAPRRAALKEKLARLVRPADRQSMLADDRRDRLAAPLLALAVPDVRRRESDPDPDGDYAAFNPTSAAPSSVEGLDAGPGAMQSVDGAGSGSGTSLRDRMPSPAF